VYELSRLLNTGLDRETLAILMALLQKGVNPEALAAVVKDLRKEAAERRADASNSASAAASSAMELESPRVRQFTGKQPLASDELQVSQVCLPSLYLRRVGGGRVICYLARVTTRTHGRSCELSMHSEEAPLRLLDARGWPCASPRRPRPTSNSRDRQQALQ
jgi:mitotic-spindle organizing protein 1